MKPVVTVISPAYNAERYLRQAIGSVLNQSEKSFEYLVVDNGSSDRTAELAERILKDRPFAKLLQTDIRGSAAARNCGLRKAAGDYIAFLDADDFWASQMLERSLAAMQSAGRGVGAVFCHSLLVLGDSLVAGRLSPRPGIYDLEALLAGACPPGNGSCLLVKRKCFEEVGEFDETLESTVDFEMWARIAADCATPLFSCFPEPLVYYRIHTDSVSGSFPDRMSSAKRLAGLDKVLSRYAEKAGPEEVQARAYVAPALFAFHGGDEQRAEAWTRQALRMGKAALAEEPAGRRLLLWLRAGPRLRKVMRVARRMWMGLAVALIKVPPVARVVRWVRT